MREPFPAWDGTTLLARAREHFVCVPGPARDVIRFSGKDAIDLLHRLSTNALVDLREGEARETILTTEKGRIVDVLLVARFSHEVLVLCSRGMASKVLEWVDRFTIADDVEGIKLSDDIAVTELIGPKAISAISSIAGLPLSKNMCVKYEHEAIQLITAENARGVHAFVVGDPGGVASLVRKLDVGPLTTEETEILRIRLGLPRAPNEINEDFNPYDVGLVDLVSFTKGCYIGQEVIARLDTYRKVRRGLVGVELSAEAAGSLPAPVSDERGEFGRLTSYATDHSLKRTFGLAVVVLEGVGDNHMVNIAFGRSVIAGHLVKLSRG